MKNSPYIRSALVQAALDQVPPLIQRTLINQRDFRKEYGIKSDTFVDFGGTDISIQRSKLFKAVRDVFAEQSKVTVTDTNGRNWKVSTDGKREGWLQILISRNGSSNILPDYFMALSPDSATRLRFLEEIVSDINLPADETNAWRDILSERGLEDEEVDLFCREFHDTPARVAQSIPAEIRRNQENVLFLVPASRRYFDRLVGKYDGSSSIRDYASGAGKKFMERLSALQPYEGFLSNLFLSSHSALTAEINVEHLEGEEIVRAFEFLAERGDKLSQLGAVEVGLRILPDIPEIETSLVHLVEQIRDDDVDGTNNGLKLFSAMFVLVDGELSRTRIFSDAPPFFRRLASLAHAALIQREIISTSIDIDSFCKWALNSGGKQFYFQSLVDMRLEPRWNPEFADASQMKAYFFGRLIIAAKNYEKNILGSKLWSLLLSYESGSLLSLINSPHLYLPGPLEGERTNSNVMPDDIAKAVECQLKASEVGYSSFIALVNSALIFRVDQSQVELATKALKISNHSLANIKNHSQMLYILRGLATVAAVSKDLALADEVRILARRYRQDKQYFLSIDEALIICLIASASQHDLKDWRESAGAWLTELAFEDFRNVEEGETFYSCLRCLRHLVPELWASCSKADAALQASLGKWVQWKI